MILIKLFILTFTILVFYPVISYGAVNLPWSTTYNCADWTQSNGLYNVNCDGLTGHGSWITSDGKEEQITSAANYPGGGGGKGQRHWLGDAPVDNSGGTRIEFASSQSELWIRWYTRFQIGFQWNVLFEYKALIVDPGLSTQILIGPRWQDQLGIVRSGNPYDSSSGGWNTIMVNGGTDARGNKTSDGQWHLFEIHLKMDTNGNNGIVEFFVDGVRRLYRTDVNYGTSAGWSNMVIGDNGGRVANGVPSAYYVDYDDMVISTSGPIGGSISTSTLPTSDNISPSIPSNLSAAAVSSSQINLSWTASTDNTGVTGYRIYRGGTQIATSTTTSYQNTGLTASTPYTYRVSAYDAAGNVSSQSTSASATTQAVVDTTPPAAPRNLIVM